MASRRKLPDQSATPLAEALTSAASKSPGGKRPHEFPASGRDEQNRKDKKNYAQNLSAELALMVAACLAPHYKKARIAPRPDGSGLEFTIGAKIDSKKTDVSVWDDAAGLILGVSIKTYSFRDFHGETKKKAAHLGRYVRNVKRNDLELRDEADVLHRRQPYAVLFALFFMPKDACWDGITGHSSFAHAVFTFRKRTGRVSADAVRSDLFEKAFVGLFTGDGSVEFFDVERAPPKNQPPRDTISLAEVIEVMRRDVILRNEGVAPEERYATDDPTWQIPDDTLPEGIEGEEPLDYADAINDAGGAREDDDVESE